VAGRPTTTRLATRETVLKLLNRLEEKGIVSCERPGVVWSIDPRIFRNLLRTEAQDLIRNRYDADPIMLQALVRELDVVLKESH
jgi:predicted transcriptional regulator